MAKLEADGTGRHPPAMELVKLYRSGAHSFFGHFGHTPGEAPIVELAQAQVEAGRGLVGDRFFRIPGGHKGQVTFFAEEVWLRLCTHFNRHDRGPGVFRRNLVVRGADLDALVGSEFTLQGIGFSGAEYCKPCVWMDHAFGPGAFQALSEWHGGGLRARVLQDGTLNAPPC